MSEDGFHPLVDAPGQAFETKARKETIGNFQPLEFKQEEAPVFAADAPTQEDSGWEPMAAGEVVLPPPTPVEDVVDVQEPDTPVDAEAEAPMAKEDPGLFEVEQQAFDMGFEKGELEGFQKGEERAMEMLVRLENLILGFEGAWRKSCESREKVMVKLALVVAEKVALAKADQDDEIAARSLVEALAALDNPGTCTVRVNPSDFQSVERLRGDLFQRVANLQEITILPDAQVDEGEVRLESDNGWLETTARKRLDEVISRVSAAAGGITPDGRGAGSVA